NNAWLRRSGSVPMSDFPPSQEREYVEPLTGLQPEAFDWLWFVRLAFGTLAIIEGDPGEGKSLVALDLCARLSTGRPMPDGTPGPGIVNSLIIQDEDGGDDTVIWRLKALGA